MRFLLGLICIQLAAQTSVDTILFNGKIITVDARDSIAEAIAIRDGKVLAVGTSAAVMRTEGAGTKMVDLKGVHMGTHAIGDRAIDYVVDTYAKILKEKPVNGMRHSVIHANQTTDHAIQTMAMLEKQYDAGTPETQPVFVYWIGDALSASYGPARSKRLMPMNSYLKAGVKWASGSDFFVTPLAPRLGIRTSVVHKSLKSTYGPDTFGTNEGVDVHNALRGYTAWAVHQMFLDDRIGTLEVGKDADIAIWDRNMYEIPSEQLKDIHCEVTLFQGRVIYRDEKSPVKIPSD